MRPSGTLRPSWTRFQALRRCLSSLCLREQYEPPPLETLRWFPGHMRTGWHQMEAKLRAVDAVVEVHDARVPLSGRNEKFGLALAARPRILVLNKADLISEQHRRKIEARLRGGPPLVFTECHNAADSGLRGLVKRLVALISGQERAVRANPREHNCMIVGVPNVGKSSLINALRGIHLRRASATPVGAKAGVTRSVLSKIKVSERPLIFVRDTPGVLDPLLSPPEAAVRLALCAALQDHLVGPRHLADYLLYWMNRRHNFSYVQHMCVSGPTDDVRTLLLSSAVSRGRYKRVRDVATGGLAHRPDDHEAALHMVKGFRTGVFGKLLLDDDMVDEQERTGVGL